MRSETLAETSDLFGKRSRGREKLKIATILFDVLVSTLAFLWVYLVFSFEFRHNYMVSAFVLSFGFVAAAAAYMSLSSYSRLRTGKPARGLVTLSLGLWAAACIGLLLSDRNYWRYMSSYYSFQDLDTYINIDPAIDKGQTYMDAGQVYFKESTVVATTKAVAFRNDNVYCAAPIVRQPLENQGGAESVEQEGSFVTPKSGTVDFWAVGIDCCDPDGKNFHCGQVDSPLSRAGLRLLRDDVRPFFVLAVQEWASAVGLPTRHPLFFYWVQDPLQEVNSYYWDGRNAFLKHVAIFLFGSAVVSVGLQTFLLNIGLS